MDPKRLVTKDRAVFRSGLRRSLALAAVLVFACACSKINVRAKGGSESKTEWEIGIPF